MKESLPKILWASFIKTQGSLVNAIGIILAFVSWIYDPNINFPLPLALFLLMLFLSLLITLIDTSLQLYKKSGQNLPKVLLGRKPSPIRKGIDALCLLEPSDLFAYDTFVALYYLEDEKFERLLGLGHVVNIQADGYIQVELIRAINDTDDIVQKLANNDKNIIEKIIVKPNVPKFFLTESGAL